LEATPICVSSEGRIMPCCTIFSRLPTSACASRHAPCVPFWISSKFHHFLYNGMTAAWQHVVGAI
jgi:hypothetical protein